MAGFELQTSGSEATALPTEPHHCPIIYKAMPKTTAEQDYPYVWIRFFLRLNEAILTALLGCTYGWMRLVARRAMPHAAKRIITESRRPVLSTRNVTIMMAGISIAVNLNRFNTQNKSLPRYKGDSLSQRIQNFEGYMNRFDKGLQNITEGAVGYVKWSWSRSWHCWLQFESH